MRTGLALLCFAILAGSTVHAEPPRFAVADVWLDTGDRPCAAWQVELAYDPGEVLLVGIESGGAAGFAPDRPPRYDQRGLKSGRIILADFTTAKTSLPAGRFRAARLHIMIKGRDAAAWTATVQACAGPDAKRFKAKATVEPAPEEQP